MFLLDVIKCSYSAMLKCSSSPGTRNYLLPNSKMFLLAATENVLHVYSCVRLPLLAAFIAAAIHVAYSFLFFFKFRTQFLPRNVEIFYCHCRRSKWCCLLPYIPHAFTAGWVGAAVTLLTPIRKVFGSNPGQYLGHPHWGFLCPSRQIPEYLYTMLRQLMSTLQLITRQSSYNPHCIVWPLIPSSSKSQGRMDSTSEDGYLGLWADVQGSKPHPPDPQAGAQTISHDGKQAPLPRIYVYWRCTRFVSDDDHGSCHISTRSCSRVTWPLGAKNKERMALCRKLPCRAKNRRSRKWIYKAKSN